MMKRRLLLVFLLVLAAGQISPLSAVIPVARSQYLQYARASADWTWSHFDELLRDWKKTFDPENAFGYRPPGSLLEMAAIYADLYTSEKKDEYALRAKKVLLAYGDFRSIYPEWAARKRPDYSDGVPALPDFFFTMRFIRVYDTLHRFGRLSPEECTRTEATIAASMAYLLRTQEWGAMNRSMLRAESLAWAIRALPRHPQVKVWETLRRSLGDDNWGNWEIEDATHYHGIWLYSLLGYADAIRGMEGLFETPEIYYYSRYFLNLMCPAGMVPDFGDAYWLSNWQHFLVFFEAAAGRYRNPQFKWAAATIARKFIDFQKPTNVGLGYMLMDCFRWGNDQVLAVPPKELSQQVMEDVLGKKIVFRDGWSADSTYLLLNYRDEGDGGLNFRDYLRDTIPVEEEKMTHGHADENSIPLLMSGGSVLLHDGGYRDYMPSGPFGAFRQDYFHNRLVVRPEKIWMGQKKGEYRYPFRDAVPGQALLDFLHNAGSYRKVRTQKVDFLTLPDFDYSRTRLIDDSMGYEWDRVVVFVKDPGLFVVFDVFKSLKEEFFTLANLWHTRQILAQGDHWYDTGYDQIGTAKLPADRRLLIVFPKTHYRMEGVETEKRHFQDELMIHQAYGQHFELGETGGFVTVLVPHAAQEDPTRWISKIRLLDGDSDRTALGVEIESGTRRITIGAKTDLRRDMARDWRRPRYLYEAGKVRFGDFETDGDFLFASRQGKALEYTVVNLTRALCSGQVLFEAQPATFGLAFDGSPDGPGVGKLRYWRDSKALAD